MKEINTHILIEKFLDDSLTENEKLEFNSRYKTEPEFAEKVNGYLNIISSIKAAEKLTAKLNNSKSGVRINLSFGLKYWSIAATVLLVISISFLIIFTIQLNKTKEKLLAYENEFNQLSKNHKENKNETLDKIENKNLRKNPETNSLTNTDEIKYIAELIEIADNIKNSRIENLQRGGGSNCQIYPIHSKLAFKENASLFLKLDKLPGNCQFILKHKNSSDTLINQQITKNVNYISLEQLDLIRGNQYYWIIKTGTSVLDVGTFIYLSKKELINYKNTLQDKTEYIKMFIKYYKNECYFDAYSLLKSGLHKYPTENIFKYYLNLYQLDY